MGGISDSGPPPAGNIGSAPQVYVGGVPSQSVTYWGRAPGSIPGLDQINFQVPPDAPLGCNVSIVVETMNGSIPVVSNAPTIALAAADGANCSDATQLSAPANPAAANFLVVSLGTNEKTVMLPNGTSSSNQYRPTSSNSIRRRRPL